MNVETAWVLLPPLGALGWTIGGTWWKPARRYLWPLSVAICITLLGIPWWRSLLTAICYGIALSLPYGDKRTWLDRTNVGLAFGMSWWWIKFVWWMPLLTALAFVGLMALSRRFNSVTWKLVENAQGFLHGLLILWLVSVPR